MRRVAIRKRPSGISTWRSLICTSVRLDKTLFIGIGERTLAHKHQVALLADQQQDEHIVAVAQLPGIAQVLF